MTPHQEDASERVELLPCPFCAGTDIRRQEHLGRLHMLYCADCRSGAESIEAWNTRSPTLIDPSDEQVERLNLLRDLVSDQIEKDGRLSSFMIRAGLLDDILTALRSPVPRELREAAQQMIDDHQTSENHHPHHILVPIQAFERMRHLIQKERSQ